MANSNCLSKRPSFRRLERHVEAQRLRRFCQVVDQMSTTLEKIAAGDVSRILAEQGIATDKPVTV